MRDKCLSRTVAGEMEKPTPTLHPEGSCYSWLCCDIPFLGAVKRLWGQSDIVFLVSGLLTRYCCPILVATKRLTVLGSAALLSCFTQQGLDWYPHEENKDLWASPHSVAGRGSHLAEDGETHLPPDAASPLLPHSPAKPSSPSLQSQEHH